jgi:hypothetical protein
MSEIIEGLMVDVPGQELIEHCKKRAAWHEDQRKDYAKKLAIYHRTKADLAESGKTERDEMMEELDPSNFKGNVSPDTLQRSATHHKKRVEFFTYLASHLLSDHTYRLEMRELNSIEAVEADLY